MEELYAPMLKIGEPARCSANSERLAPSNANKGSARSEAKKATVTIKRLLVSRDREQTC